MHKHSHDDRQAPEIGSNALPSGLLLGEFEIIETLNESSTGLVYLAWDRKSSRRAALKEYLPASIAARAPSRHAAPFAQVDAYMAGLHAFLNEARLLAQCDAPALVKPYRWWQANGTAYSAAPYQEGAALDQAFRQGRIAPKEEWLRSFLAGLLDAVETLHRAQRFHHNIGPDNILLLKDGKPLLLGFSAALRAAGALAGEPDAGLKHGYAALEQYAHAGMQAGSWTDVHALAATMYFLIAGRTPPPAPLREQGSRMTPLREAGRGRYSDALLSTLDRALALQPDQRIQTVAELRYALDSERPHVRVVPPPPMPEPPAWQALAAEPRPMPPQRTAHPWLATLLLCAGVAAGAGGAYWWAQPDITVAQAPRPAAARPVATPAPAMPRSMPALPVAAPIQMPARVEEIRTTGETAIARTPEPKDVEAPPPLKRATPPAPPASSAATPNYALENELWELANESGKAGAYQTYLMAYPKGRYAYAAKLRLAALKSAQATAAPADGPAQ